LQRFIGGKVMPVRQLRLFLGITAVFFATMPGFAQHAEKTFEVTSVRENLSGLDRDSGVNLSGSRISGTNLSLRTLILQAYGVLDFQVTSGPAWLSTARFDLQATTENAEPIAPADLQPMLQRLLADRFHLTLHHESREMKAYVLVIDKGGPKLHEASGAPAKSMSGTNQRGSSGTATMTGSGVSMTALAYRIAQQPAFRGSMVLNKTGLNGYYDFTLQWEAGENAGPSLIAALREQLGMKLSSEKSPVDVLVIDRAEKPSEN
jgi:uncharacterized protein (TIGR03435 family)